VDLYINGVYRGVYVFSEKVWVEDGKVDIESEHAGAAAPFKTDTGYLLFYGNGMHVNNGEDDRARFAANAGNELLVESPKVKDIDDPEVPEATANGFRAQRDYIQARTRELVAAMSASNFNTFLNIADVGSFVDGYIIQELYANTDVRDAGYYLFKKSTAQGGKWYCGPPWDFDATVRGSHTGIRVGNAGDRQNPLIYNLYGIPAFRELVKARWKAVSGDVKAYLTAKFNFYMNDEAYREAFMRGAGGSEGGNPTAPITVTNNNWQNDAQGRRDWLINRCNWLDGEWGV